MAGLSLGACGSDRSCARAPLVLEVVNSSSTPVVVDAWGRSNPAVPAGTTRLVLPSGPPPPFPWHISVATDAGRSLLADREVEAGSDSSLAIRVDAAGQVTVRRYSPPEPTPYGC